MKKHLLPLLGLSALLMSSCDKAPAPEPDVEKKPSPKLTTDPAVTGNEPAAPGEKTNNIQGSETDTKAPRLGE